MTQGIYQATLKSTGEVLYVGQSQRLEERLREHQSSLDSGTHCNSYLQRVFNKYQQLVWEVIESEVEIGLLIERELYWIRTLNPRCNLLVPTESDTWTHSPETREKMSLQRRGRVQSPEHVESRTRSRTATTNSPGYVKYSLTPEHRDRISESSRTRIRTPEEKERISLGLLGHTTSSQTREKISQTLRSQLSQRTLEESRQAGLKIREGMRESGASDKISRKMRGRQAWNKGLPRTDEVKAKLSADWAKRPVVECPYCDGSYRLLASHITKKHGGES